MRVRACRLGERATTGGGGMAMVQMNGLNRACRRDAKGKEVVVWFLPSLVCCSLSEVRSGRFEGRGFGGVEST